MGSTVISHKRGDTWNKLITLKNDDGSAVDLTGWEISSQARLFDRLIATFEVVPVDLTAGQFRLVAEDTEDWPTYSTGSKTRLDCDIQYTDGQGVIRSTETFYIRVERSVTYADSD